MIYSTPTPTPTPNNTEEKPDKPKQIHTKKSPIYLQNNTEKKEKKLTKQKNVRTSWTTE